MDVSEIASHFGGEVEGDATLEIKSVVNPDIATGDHDLAVAIERRFLSSLATTKAAAAFAPIQAKGAIQIASETVLWVRADRETLPRLSALFAYRSDSEPGIHKTAVVGADCVINDSARIGPHCVIGNNVTIEEKVVLLGQVTVLDNTHIGKNALIHSGVRIGANVRIGERVIVQPNATIGADGFSFLPVDPGNVEAAKLAGEVATDDTRDSTLLKVESLGGVIVEDDVEIGALTAVDAGTLVPTRIGRGTKIDDMVMIGHNVQIGEDCLICAQVGLAGSAKIGNRVTLGGRSAVADNLTVGDDVVLGAQAAAGSNVPSGSVYLGMPAVPRARALKDIRNIRRLDRIIKKVLGT